MLTGSVLVDLRDVPRERQRHRVLALAQAPDGCRAQLVVGALAAEPEAVRTVREHVDRLQIDICGEPHAVQLWLDALRFGDELPLGRVV